MKYWLRNTFSSFVLMAISTMSTHAMEEKLNVPACPTDEVRQWFDVIAKTQYEYFLLAQHIGTLKVSGKAMKWAVFTVDFGEFLRECLEKPGGITGSLNLSNADYNLVVDLVIQHLKELMGNFTEKHNLVSSESDIDPEQMTEYVGLYKNFYEKILIQITTSVVLKNFCCKCENDLCKELINAKYGCFLPPSE